MIDPKTHDLSRLAKLAELQEFPGFMDFCETLGLFSVQARYPADMPEVSIQDAQEHFKTGVEYRTHLLEKIQRGIEKT